MCSLILCVVTLTGCNMLELDKKKYYEQVVASVTSEQSEYVREYTKKDVVNITSAQIYEGYGGYQGYITTYFLTVAGIPKHDRVFTFSILEVENNQPLLDVSFQGELDSDDVWAGNYPYKIIKLTDTDMWWQVNTNGDKSIIKFRHRNDIQIE